MSTLEPNADQRPDPKQTFLRYLPERVATIEEDWRALADREWNSSKLEQILQRVQDLSSVADKFGLTNVHGGLSPLTQCFHALIGIKETPSKHQIEQIDDLLRWMNAVCQEESSSTGRVLKEVTEQPLQIFYLCGSQTLAPRLASALDGYHYSLSQFSKMAALLEAAALKIPAAVVVDIDALPQEGMVYEQEGTAPALIVLSATGSLDARLLALRAGAKAFFVVPIDIQRVAAKLHQVINSAPEQPHRILVMDDDPPQASFAMAILRKSGLDVRAVTNPEDVLTAIEEFCPDLILMDVYMPKIDGLQLTRIIREQTDFADVPIVFMSGEQDIDKQLEALNSGGDGFVTKPIRVHYLRTIINSRILRSKTSQYQTIDLNDRDPATGLFNRRGLFARLNKLLANGARALMHGLVCLEIDDIDSIKKSIGFKKTEALMAAISALLLTKITPQDLCARIDDHRFAVLATRPQKQELTQLGETLVQSIAQRNFPIEGLNTQIALSSGLCLFSPAPADGLTVEQQAISACHLARKDGGNRLAIYDAVNVGTTAQPVQVPAPASAQPSAPPDVAKLLRQALQNSSFAVSIQQFAATHKQPFSLHELNWSLPINDSRSFASQSVLTFAQPLGLNKDIDRWLVGTALDKLQEYRQTGRHVLLLLHQTAETISDTEYANWLRGELRKRLLVGTGLVLEWHLIDLVNNIKSAYALMKELSVMGVENCLAQFSQNEASYKVLKYLKNPYIKLSEKFLSVDVDTIDIALQRINEFNPQIIVPKVPELRTINQAWLTKADFISKDTT